MSDFSWANEVWPKPTLPGPYIARTASDRNKDWPIWYVAGPDGRLNYMSDIGGDRLKPLTAMFSSREVCEYLANKWNKETE